MMRMIRQLGLLTVLIVVLLGPSSAAFKVHPVRASGTIYIRADGTVEGTDKIEHDREFYTFIDNIYGEIVVERNNIIVDGGGYALQGTDYPSEGINLNSVSNVTITNCNIRGFWIGIHLNSTSHSTLCGNDMESNSFPIWLSYASENNIFGNNIKGNENGIWAAHSSQNVISENNITANKLGLGIGFANSPNNTISGNNIKGNYEGIYLDRSSNNRICGNNIVGNDPLGIWHYSSSNNTIIANNIKSNYKGLYLWHSGDNLIFGNDIATNSLYGVYLDDSHNNKFYHNDFIENTRHVYIYSYTSGYNMWDDGEMEGNYWDNYTGTDLTQDGIGESTHVLDVHNQDNYPLMGTFSDFPVYWANKTYHVTTICNSTISDFQFGEVIVYPNYTLGPPWTTMIRFEVRGYLGGFCRIRIPKDVLDGDYVVTLDGFNMSPSTWRELPISDETTLYLYLTYPPSSHDVWVIGTTMVPELHLVTLALFITVTLVAALIYKRNRLTNVKR